MDRFADTNGNDGFLNLTPRRIELGTELPTALKMLNGLFSFALLITILSPLIWLPTVLMKRFRLPVREHSLPAGCLAVRRSTWNFLTDVGSDRNGLQNLLLVGPAGRTPLNA